MKNILYNLLNHVKPTKVNYCGIVYTVNGKEYSIEFVRNHLDSKPKFELIDFITPNKTWETYYIDKQPLLKLYEYFTIEFDNGFKYIIELSPLELLECKTKFMAISNTFQNEMIDKLKHDLSEEVTNKTNTFNDAQQALIDKSDELERE